MHERIIIPESVFSVAEDGSEYATAVREMDLDEIIEGIPDDGFHVFARVRQ